MQVPYVLGCSSPTARILQKAVDIEELRIVEHGRLLTLQKVPFRDDESGITEQRSLFRALDARMRFLRLMIESVSTSNSLYLDSALAITSSPVKPKTPWVYPRKSPDGLVGPEYRDGSCPAYCDALLVALFMSTSIFDICVNRIPRETDILVDEAFTRVPHKWNASPSRKILYQHLADFITSMRSGDDDAKRLSQHSEQIHSELVKIAGVSSDASTWLDHLLAAIGARHITKNYGIHTSETINGFIGLGYLLKIWQNLPLEDDDWKDIMPGNRCLEPDTVIRNTLKDTGVTIHMADNFSANPNFFEPVQSHVCFNASPSSARKLFTRLVKPTDLQHLTEAQKNYIRNAGDTVFCTASFDAQSELVRLTRFTIDTNDIAIRIGDEESPVDNPLIWYYLVPITVATNSVQILHPAPILLMNVDQQKKNRLDFLTLEGKPKLIRIPSVLPSTYFYYRIRAVTVQRDAEWITYIWAEDDDDASCYKYSTLHSDMQPVNDSELVLLLTAYSNLLIVSELIT